MNCQPADNWYILREILAGKYPWQSAKLQLGGGQVNKLGNADITHIF